MRSSRLYRPFQVPRADAGQRRRRPAAEAAGVWNWLLGAIYVLLLVCAMILAFTGIML